MVKLLHDNLFSAVAACIPCATQIHTGIWSHALITSQMTRSLRAAIKECIAKWSGTFSSHADNEIWMFLSVYIESGS